MTDEWEQLQGALTALGESTQNEIKEYFNEILDDYDEIGDLLFGEVNDFKCVIANMSKGE